MKGLTKKQKFLYAALCVGILTALSGFSSCKVVNGRAVYGDDFTYAPGTNFSVTCNGVRFPSMIMNNSEFSISVQLASASCSFDEVMVPNGFGGINVFSCWNLMGQNEPGNCNFQITADQGRYEFEKVIYGYRCLIVNNCEAYCMAKGICPGNSTCQECINNCENNKCS